MEAIRYGREKSSGLSSESQTTEPAPPPPKVHKGGNVLRSLKAALFGGRRHDADAADTAKVRRLPRVRDRTRRGQLLCRDGSGTAVPFPHTHPIADTLILSRTPTHCGGGIWNAETACGYVAKPSL